MKNKPKGSKLFSTIKYKTTETKRIHEEQHRLHMEYHRKIKELYGNNNEFERMQKRVKFSRPFIIVFNILLWFLIFHFFGVRTLSIGIALVLGSGSVMQFIFLANLQKRIFNPINQLRDGVEEVTKGNYDIKVKSDINNEIGRLVESFNKMAEKLKESENLKLQYEENRKALIANISHDLKTPITSIQGYIETMADRTDIPQETLNKYHQIIYKNAAYMNKLIDDLFLFSKLDMEKVDFQFDNISIKAFMDDLMQEFEFELEDRNIEFHYEDKMIGCPNVNIDRKRIHQVFSNIIGNAVKYGNEDKMKIIVSLYERDDLINIDIWNNGSSIPEDKLPYIFDRFYRVDYARTKNLMSTGLGLAISKELVEAHGGKITVTSRENEGTCFTIRLSKHESEEGE